MATSWVLQPNAHMQMWVATIGGIDPSTGAPDIDMYVQVLTPLAPAWYFNQTEGPWGVRLVMPWNALFDNISNLIPVVPVGPGISTATYFRFIVGAHPPRYLSWYTLTGASAHYPPLAGGTPTPPDVAFITGAIYDGSF